MTDPTAPENAGADRPGGEPPGAAAPLAAPAPPPVAASGCPPAGRAKARPPRPLPDLGTIAVAAGVFGLLAGPFLIARPDARLVILAADVLALALGAFTVWGATRRSARLDWGIAAIITGGVSLFMYLAYVTDPPPPGGT